MNKKKFITCALAAMMLASMALPASAADASNSDYGNTTDVVLNYGDEDIPSLPSDDGAFTIKIPAQINLEAENNGDAGVILSGEGDIEFSGMIGQNDFVKLSVYSENNYQLIDSVNGESVAHYGIVTTTEDGGIELKHYDEDKNGGYFCSFITSDFSKLSTDPTPLDACETRDMSDNYAQAFQGNGSITMTFQNNGDNEIFGKGEYNDTLTFSYQYNYLEGYYIDSGDLFYTTEDYSTVNINNGEVTVIDIGDDTDVDTDVDTDDEFEVTEDEFEVMDSYTSNYGNATIYLDSNYYLHANFNGASYDLNDGTYKYTIMYGGVTYAEGYMKVSNDEVVKYTSTSLKAINEELGLKYFRIVVNDIEIDNFKTAAL